MARTFIRQDTQIRNSDEYNDTISPSLSNYETNPTNIEDDLNSLRSQVNNVLTEQTGNWYDTLVTPTALDAGTARGVNSLNTDLHAVERKRVLVAVSSLADVTVGTGNNFVILSGAQLPSNTTAAIGAVTTRGTVVAHNSSFGSHSLAEVSGTTAISPKNLCEIVDGATRDPILSDGRVVYALLQSESNTDGSTLTGTTPNRAQLSFVRINAAGDDLEAVPFADIEGRTINYASVERKAFEDLSEQDFLRGAIVDVPAGSTVTRQVAYDNQGTTPVNLTTNATLDLEGPGLIWAIRDDLEANLFRIIEGSAGGTSECHIASDVDTFNVDAAVNDFAEGLRVDTGGQRINIGETAGLIESVSSNDLRILGAGELYLDDGNQAGSTWAQTAGIKLSDTTAEWNDFEAAYGEVSLLRALYLARAAARGKTFHPIGSPISANNNVTTGVDLSGGNFLTDYDVFLNGNLLRPGADSSANHDYYPGDNLSTGQLKFEFNLKPNDVLCIISYV
jgi:hypothetical protein